MCLCGDFFKYRCILLRRQTETQFAKLGVR